MIISLKNAALTRAAVGPWPALEGVWQRGEREGGYRVELPVCLSYLHVQVKRFLAAGKLIPSPWLMKDTAHGMSSLPLQSLRVDTTV